MARIDKDSVKADFSIPKWERFTKGLALICTYDPDPDFAAEHDIFYFSDYEATTDRMTEDDQRLLFTYNWVEVDGSWAFFT